MQAAALGDDGALQHMGLGTHSLSRLVTELSQCHVLEDATRSAA
jgi:hypothetical protein